MKGNGADHPRILSGADFIADVQSPVWLIKGTVQRGRLYACTSLTGHGKTAVWLFNACMIHAGRTIGNLRTVQGNCLILAGENPEDLKYRMLAMMAAFNLKPEQLPYVLPATFPLTPEAADALKLDIEALGVALSLIIGDTAASFFPGEDENDNVQAGEYGRRLRQFTKCRGNPAVAVLSHPVKHAAQDNLLPRGGGAFLNELDGNLTLWAQGETTSLHWHGKIRGPDFNPIPYRLKPVKTPLIDQWGDALMSVIAEPMSDEAAADHVKQTVADEDAVLRMLRDHPDWGGSPAQIARNAGWVDDADSPQRWKVHRALDRLKKDDLVYKPRSGKGWKITPKGEKELGGPNVSK